MPEGEDITYVQSFIAHVSFPQTLAQVLRMVGEHEDGYGYTNMEQLLDPSRGESFDWTAPRWVTTGDIVFYYHTKKSVQRIEKLLRASLNDDDAEWAELSDPNGMIDLLEDQREIALQYSGTIFGCAQVSGAAEFNSYGNLDDERRHWLSHIYAPTCDPHAFEHPLPDSEFRKSVKLNTGGALTPLHGGPFAKLKAQLAETNNLPSYLARAQPGGVSFRNVDRSNWISVSCRREARFIDESQLRVFFLDFLLEELKDTRTRVFQECRCERGARSADIADYFVRVGGKWIPVEAKLNVQAERDLPSQVAKYVRVRSFSPTKGVGVGTVQAASEVPICLVADASGLYLVSDKGYLFGCSQSVPLWPRTSINDSVIRQIRAHLEAVV